MPNIELDTRELELNLQNLSEEVEKNLEKSLGYGARLIEKSAKLKCPVDTGRLRLSISVDQKKLTAIIGTNVEYAPHIEYGTKYQRAQPFLRPAYDENIDELLELVAEAVIGG